MLHELHFIREFTRLLLRIDENSINDYFKNAPRRLDQFNLQVAMFLQQCRQTDGTGFVTSHGTVFNRRTHRIILYKSHHIAAFLGA